MVNTTNSEVSTNRKLLRIILMLSYVLVLSIILFLLSSIISYFNTGADRSALLHTEIKKAELFLPKMTWNDNGNEGRPMNEQTLKNIENDYIDAWYVKQMAYLRNSKKGIDDYYTKNARKNLFNHINFNTKEKIHIESTTISHHPDIEFFSEDGQLIMLKDTGVISYKKIFKNNILLTDVVEKADYKFVLLAEDGFWRIRHSVKENTKEININIPSNYNKKLSIKGINYYPQATPWEMFGEGFNPDVIDSDFKIIQKANLNTIRVFVPYEEFGKAKVLPRKLEKLKTVLDLAHKNNLKVIVTLFDFYGNYATADWTLNHRHAETIVSTLKNHEALLAWDLKNEPDLDFDSRGKEQVIAWLKHLIVLIKKIDAHHPITVGWAHAKSASILGDQLDFISFHYYENLNNFENTYLALLKEIPEKQIVLGEFGVSSYSGLWKPFGSSKKKQANYHKEMQEILSKNDISFLSWTLYDFENVPTQVVGKLPWRVQPQKRFGFIDSEGNKKPSFEYISK